MSDLIKTMKLYVKGDRVFNELRELGLSDDDPLKVEVLTAFDQYHYEGVTAVEQAIDQCGIRSNHHILEVGSGIGGPARYLAHKAGCQVTALELQADLNLIAQSLTERCGLGDRINHQQGDFLEANAAERPYDGVASWLAFLHIPNRKRLFEQCFSHIKPQGFLYIEDFSKLNEFTKREQQDLESKIFCKYVPTVDEYIGQVKAAGFKDVQIEDMTSGWTKFVRSRLDAFRASHDRNLRVHGQATVDGLDDFYATMTSLYEGGNLGGIRLIARK